MCLSDFRVKVCSAQCTDRIPLAAQNEFGRLAQTLHHPLVLICFTKQKELLRFSNA